MYLCVLVNVIATGSKKQSQRPLRAFGLNSMFILLNPKSLDCADFTCTNFTCAEFLEVPHIFGFSLITLMEFFHCFNPIYRGSLDCMDFTCTNFTGFHNIQLMRIFPYNTKGILSLKFNSL